MKMNHKHKANTCLAAAFVLCRIRGEAHAKEPDYRPIHDFLAFAAAEGIYILVMILTGGRTFSTVNVLYACMAVLGESAATNEAIRDNYPGLVALMIVCMNVVTLPFAFLGFVSGKKKRESDRASMLGRKYRRPDEHMRGSGEALSHHPHRGRHRQRRIQDRREDGRHVP